MEGDPGSGFSLRLSDWNAYDPIKPNILPNLGNPTIGFPFQNTTPATISADYVLPFRGVPGLPLPRMGQSSEQLGWFYCLPRYHQALVPATRNLPLKDCLSIDPSAERVTADKLYEGTDVGAAPKFFVFDQSGGQTALVFGHENNGVPMPHLSMARSKKFGVADSGGEGLGDEIVSEGGDENDDVDADSEMHEDTEELNALLYSDDDSEYFANGEDDDEVASTGHSPSTMTDHLDPNNTLSEEDSEEVASSPWPPSKKQKLTNELLADTAASENQMRNFYSDDAISSSNDIKSISLNSAIKRARIRKTVSLLQSLVPGMKGKDHPKDPILILDEAIGYLKTLKLKAATLGLIQL